MKAGKSQEISREIIGDNRELWHRLEQVADRSKIEEILLEYKEAVKQARGAKDKSLVKRARCEAFLNLCAVASTNSVIGDADKFQTLSREVIGEHVDLLEPLGQVADRQRVESILLAYETAAKEARGAMRETLVKMARRQAFLKLSTAISLQTNMNDIDTKGEFSAGVLIALLQESIDTSTEIGKREWALLESYSGSTAAVEILIAKLRSWLVKMDVADPQITNWVEMWKLYAARKLAAIPTPVTLVGADVPDMDVVLEVANTVEVNMTTTDEPDVQAMAAHIDGSRDYSPAALKAYLLASCHGDEAEVKRAYIESETDTPEKLATFITTILNLAGDREIAEAEEVASKATSSPVTALLTLGLQVLLFEFKRDNRPSPVPVEPRAWHLNKGVGEFENVADENEHFDRISLGLGEDPAERSKVTVLADLPAVTSLPETDFPDVFISLGEEETEVSFVRPREITNPLGEATGETSGIIAVNQLGDSQAIESLKSISADPSLVDMDKVSLTVDPAITNINARRTLTPIQNGIARNLPRRQGLLSSLASVTGPMFAVAASMLLAAGLTGRTSGSDTNSRGEMITDVRASTTTLHSVTSIANSPRREREVCTDQVVNTDHNTLAVVSPKPLVFYTEDVLPEGPNTCIMGGAKHVMRTRFNIVDELRLEQLSTQAETAIRVARPVGIHTKPGDQVALAYDEVNQTWLVRQLRGGQTIVQASFASTDSAIVAFHNETVKPNLLTKLWNKGKSLWQSFRGLWA